MNETIHHERLLDTDEVTATESGIYLCRKFVEPEPEIAEVYRPTWVSVLIGFATAAVVLGTLVFLFEKF